MVAEGAWNQEASRRRPQEALAANSLRLQPIHRAHNQETLSATGQLTCAGPSPPRHACNQTHGKINPHSSTLLGLCFGSD